MSKFALKLGKHLIPRKLTKLLPLAATVGWVAVFTLKAIGEPGHAGAIEEFLKALGVEPGVGAAEIALTVGSVQGLVGYCVKAWKEAVAETKAEE